MNASHPPHRISASDTCALILLVLALMPAWALGLAEPPNRLPNVVLILADDIGYGDLGCYGATRVHTPNLDRLASQGLRFTDAYAPASVCTPTRYSILTGEYAWRTTVGRAVLNGDAPLCIAPHQATLPGMLRQAGYRTACIGKWHLGFGTGRADYNGVLRPGPLDIGFDSFFGIPATGDRVPCVLVDNDRVAAWRPEDPIQIDYKKKVGAEPTGLDKPEALKLKPDRQHAGTIVNGISRIGFMSGGHAARWRDEDFAGIFAEKAVAFIEQNSVQPFFLYLATHDIHAPRYPHERFMKDSRLGRRGGAIAQLDWTVGEVLAALQRCGLEENTLVLFSSDNGGATSDGYEEPPLEGHRFNGPLRGLKSGLWEGGSRVPLIVRWPSSVRPGSRSAIVGLHDLFATMAEILGHPLPANAARDSISFLPILRGAASPQRRQSIVLQSGTAQLALRVDDWKFIPNLSVVGGWYKDRSEELSGEGLFHLPSDPGEQRNRAAEEPERLAELRDRLNRIRSRGERALTSTTPTSASVPAAPAFTHAQERK